MPSKPINWKTGKIYKLYSDHTDEIYVGSTTKKYLRDRLRAHKNAKKRYEAGKEKANYVTSYQMLDYDDCRIVLIEDYPCENRQQLHSRERHWIENTPNCVNKNIPTRTMKEYQKVNREKLTELNREYRQENKEKMVKYDKQYYTANRDKILERKKVYGQENKDKIKEKRQQQFKCECGASVGIHKKQRHFKSQKHITFIATKQDENQEA